MQGALDFGTMIYAWLAAVPVVSFLGIWIMVYWITRNSQATTRLAMDITFWLLIGAVSDKLRLWTGSAWLLWVILFLLLIAAGRIGRRREQLKGGSDPFLLLKWITRSGFLVLSLLYVVLLLFQLVVAVAGG